MPTVIRSFDGEIKLVREMRKVILVSAYFVGEAEGEIWPYSICFT